jgi:hypothetical protein
MAIEKIHLYDQALAFIEQDAMNVIIKHPTLRNIDGGDTINAYEVLAREFESYWRSVIGDEVARVFGLDPMKPDVLLLTIWKLDDDEFK